MAEPVLLRNLAWAATTALEIILLAEIVRRKMYRSHPLFSLYVLSTIVQSAFAFGVYWHWGYSGDRVWDLIWTSQGMIVFLRALAVWEVTRKLLSAYSGAWALASRIELAIGIAICAACGLASRWTLYDGVMDADRGVEVSIATVIVFIFVFLRYYGLTAKAPDRQLAVGFCLYSIFFAINFSLLQRYLLTFVNFWNFLNILTFLATLFIWTNAARSYSISSMGVTETRKTGFDLTTDAYSNGSQQLNRRMTSLNERLNRLSGLRGRRH